jgi:hypothetical protein
MGGIPCRDARTSGEDWLMFAPPGYITADELIERFVIASTNKFSFDLLRLVMDPDLEVNRAHRAASDDGSISPVTAAALRRLYDAKSIFPIWAIWQICRERLIAPYICSPDCIVLRAGANFFYGPMDLQFYEFMLPVDEDSTLAEFLDQRREGEKENGLYLNLVDDGWFLSPESWLIRDRDEIVSAIEASVILEEDRARQSYNNVSEALDRNGVSDVEREPFDERSAETAMQDYQQIIRDVSRFSGWALCFKEDEVPKNADDLLSLVGFTVNEKITPSGDLSQREIVAEIVRMAEAGLPVVRDEVKRTLASHMKAEEWRETWKQVSNLHPEVSRRGPKKGGRNLRN